MSFVAPTNPAVLDSSSADIADVMDVMEGYDPDIALAQHLLDEGTPTSWAADTLGIPTLDWVEERGRHVSGDFEIDWVGHNVLLENGHVVRSHESVETLKTRARIIHRARSA